MKAVNLLYLADPRFGGWVTYTAHLAASLRAMGVSVALFKLGNRFEAKTRSFGYGLAYQNLSIDAARELARGAPFFIVAAAPKYEAALDELLRLGAGVCIHDPTEVKGDLLEVLKRSTRPVVTIRKPNAQRLTDAGVRACFIPHPYQRQVASVPTEGREWHAISLSRLDWDKHTDILVEANKRLPASRAVRIYGAENTMFTHHKVATIDAEWRRNYVGRFPAEIDAAIRLAEKSRYVVDMSTIAGDGDGTQYTFLEAWDAGAVLVVHEKWIVTGRDSVRHGETALVAGTGAELAALLSKRRDLAKFRAAGEQELQKHAAAVVVPQYQAVLGL